MKPTLTAFLLLVFSSLFAQAPDWTATPTPSSSTVVAQILVDGLWAPAGATLAAFDPQGHCAGSTTLVSEGAVTYCTLTLYGDDATTPAVDEGMNGSEPFTLRLHLPETGEVLTWFGPNGNTPLSGWTNTNGAPLPGYDDPNGILAFHSNTSTSCATDLDGDGLVAVQDLLVLLSDFGLPCTVLTND